MKKPVALIILDGFGSRDDNYGNAITAANTPNIDNLFATCSHVNIGASGMDVGLPDGQMGNSEVGHTNIGAGRIVYQELTRITKSIKDGDFFANQALVSAMDNCIAKGTALHLCGLLSDGGVHSHVEHLYGLLTLAKQKGLEKVYVHGFLDGRDVPPSSGIRFVKDLVAKMEEIGVGKVGSLAGRYYAMDRDNRWERVSQAYEVMVNGKGNANADPVALMEESYANGLTDEFVLPTVCTTGATISAHDSVIFFNFRPDRAREITRTMVDASFAEFPREKGHFPLCYVCMTQYDSTMPNVVVAFKPQSLKNTFGAYIAEKGLSQLRIAETEKYAHVTFFFNGGMEAPCVNEDRALIASPKVATYDLQPEMSANEVAEEVVARLDTGKYDVMILNFANCDMVGHTGFFDAAVSAVETVDTCLGKVVAKINELGGVALITADHGNADQMYEPDGSPFTAHTINPVPLILVGSDAKLAEGGKLADLAPTMLELLGLDKPTEMTGVSLLVK